MQDFSVSQQATQLTDSQISILKQLVFTPPSELDAKLAQFAEKESLSSRFIIKMEIARLFKPCSRVIDLRDTYPDCKLFDMHGVKHYLNNQAKSILVNNIKMFKGYTNGVYESVINTMKKIKQTNQKTHAGAFLPDANFFSVTGFHKRRNQRLFCVSKLKVFLQDPSKRNKSRDLPASEDAISTDISIEGLCIKMKNSLPENTEFVFVRFCGFESEFSFSFPLVFKYKIAGVVEKNEFFYYKAEFDGSNSGSAVDEFHEHLSKYIFTQSRRYKVPIENTFEAVMVKGYEQYAIEKLSSLPLYLRFIDGVWAAESAFLTSGNEFVSSVFHSDDGRCMFNDVVGLDCIQSRLSNNKRDSFYVLASHVISSSHHSNIMIIPVDSLSSDELALNVARTAYAKSDGSFYLLRLDLMSANPEQEHYIPTSLPDSYDQQVSIENRPPNARARLTVSGYERLVVITDESHLLCDIRTLSEKPEISICKSDLLKFIPLRSMHGENFFFARNEINDQRVEPRFDYKFNLVVRTDKKPKQRFSSYTIDISSKGLKIKEIEGVALGAGDIIYLDFEPSDKIRETPLSVPYRVVGIKGGFMHLAIYGKPQLNNGYEFLKKFININLNTLDASGGKNEVFGISRVVRNIFSYNHPSPFIFLKRIDYTRYISDVAISNNSNIPVFSEDNDENSEILRAVMKSEACSLLLNRAWGQIKRGAEQNTFYIAVTAKKKSSEPGFYLKVRDADEIIKNGKIGDLMLQSSCIGITKVLQFSITRKGRVFNKYFKGELLYLTRFAPNRAKIALNAISSVDALGCMTDVGSDLLRLLAMNSQHIASDE